MEDFQLVIGKFLRTGTIISFIIILLGGVFYLAQHSGDAVNYKIFKGESLSLTSFSGIVQDVFTFSAVAIIQLGLFALVIVQVIRVMLTAWYLFKLDNRILLACCLFILFILVGNMFWHI